MRDAQFAMFSGGRSSFIMAEEMMRRHEPVDGIIFNNTALESPQTYEFLEAADGYFRREFRKGIILLEWRPEPPYYAEVASVGDLLRDGSVFQGLINNRQFVPNQRFRVCTQTMKIEVTTRYLKALTGKSLLTEGITRCVGMRVGEEIRIHNGKRRNDTIAALAHREYKSLTKSEKKALKGFSGSVRYPLYEWGFNQGRVRQRMRELAPALNLPFDISDYAVHLSNCSGCFAKNPLEQEQTLQNNPIARQFWLHNENINFSDVAPFIKARKKRMRVFKAWFKFKTGIAWDMRRKGMRDTGKGFWAKHYPIAAIPWLAEARRKAEANPLFDSLYDTSDDCESGYCGVD